MAAGRAHESPDDSEDEGDEQEVPDGAEGEEGKTISVMEHVSTRLEGSTPSVCTARVGWNTVCGGRGRPEGSRSQAPYVSVNSCPKR